MKRIVLGVQYDGNSWRGWQKQPSGDTVQDVLERALKQFTNQPVQPEPDVSLADDNSLDFTLPDLDLSAPLQDSVPELTIEASPEVSDPAQAIELSLSGESSGEDVPVLDFALEEPAQTEQEPHLPADVQASAFDFDLSGIDLNLEPQVASDAESVASPETEPENAEMSTKLDLAVAYQEIGDREGARELLEEVVRGGNADQRERANAMLLQLA